MSTQINELAHLAKAVSADPENYQVKTQTLAVMKEVKTLALKGDKMAQYQLAQVYPVNSTAYRTWMEAAAAQELPNARLALAQVYISNGKNSGIQQAAQQIVKILASDDSYIKAEAKILMKQIHLLGAEVQRQMTKGVGKSAFTLFAHETKAVEKNQYDLQNATAPAA